jgi:hypothetical protein
MARFSAILLKLHIAHPCSASQDDLPLRGRATTPSSPRVARQRDVQDPSSPQRGPNNRAAEATPPPHPELLMPRSYVFSAFCYIENIWLIYQSSDADRFATRNIDSFLPEMLANSQLKMLFYSKSRLFSARNPDAFSVRNVDYSRPSPKQIYFI